jgi:prepilin-type N-terminal cleavage/methylation domain-containing protein
MAPPKKPLRGNAVAGFTLIELLVVVSIILIVASVIFVGGKSGSGTQLSASQRILSGIAQGARGQAILKGATTRIIIYSDSAANSADDKKLRYCGIIYADTSDSASLDPAGNPTQWIAATQGNLLPEGIYFNPILSEGKSPSSLPKMTLEYPRVQAVSQGSGAEYYYYEFKSNGTMASSPINFSNSWLILQAGTLKPSSAGVLEVDFGAAEYEYLVAGLIFRRVGTTTLVSNPADIITP